MKAILRRLLTDGVVPNHLRDTQLLLGSLVRRDEGSFDPILLSLGEPWSGPPEALTRHLERATPESHGYLLSMYGLPECRQALRRFVTTSERWGAEGERLFEVAVSWTGTRAAMVDFFEYLRDEWKH